MSNDESERSPQSVDQRGIYLMADTPPAAHPLAVVNGSDVEALHEALDRYLTLEEIDVLLSELRNVANERRERNDYE